MDKKKTKKNGRASGQTQVSISMRQDVLDAIDAAAAKENRSRSNWLVNMVLKSLGMK